MRINEVYSKFDAVGKFVRVEICDCGHINDTYIVYTDAGRRYILQRINNSVFPRVDLLMNNIVTVTEYLAKKVREDGGSFRECMRVVRTRDGDSFFWYVEDNCFYRMYDMVEGARTYQRVENSKQFFGAGKAFGRFQKRLQDFDVSLLYDSIEDFHNTPKRLAALDKARQEDKFDRVKDCLPELSFLDAQRDISDLITSALDNGSIPLRVTHNDTKLNNVLLDDITGEGVCVIDLDTVMRGAGVYDFGDAIRSGCNTAPEGTRNVDEVGFDLTLFQEFSKGFLGEVGRTYNELEWALLVPSCQIMTYELAIRFLTDYLSGDVYFKTRFEGHNLFRARSQIKLFKEMKKAEARMNKIIADVHKTI